ncbi:mitochondrial antiviral-signaling protein isoform X2 [Emydura macquarii macquarii]|uniref:mitochondrial antiviral-signaling protein isoform X2 n=1 Tax=Emydura macquarii macquarii TaxID=1129001 RepID=UPI00352A2450
MGFAEDKVYEYIKQNMPDFHCIRVNQLIRHLPCLSDADREEIAAYDDRKGNEHAVGELFVRLKCRRDWVRQFIRALRRNEQQDLADRVESEYNAHQVRPRNNAPGPAVNNSLPSSVSVCSQVLPLAANPDRQCAGPTFENNPHTSSLPRQPASLPGPGTPLPHQSNPPAARLDALKSSAESCLDRGDYNTPIQEMEPLAKQKVTEDALTPRREDPSPQPTGNIARADLRASHGSGNHGDGLAPAAVKLSPQSPVGHQLACEGAPRRGMEMAEPGMPVSEPSAQRQDWAGRQQHPVCVRGGYFGNMNHLNIGSNSKASVPGDPVQRGELAAAVSPEDFKNQPEEVNFSSFERSPLASSANRAVHGEGQQAGDSFRQQNFQALQGSEHGNLTSSMVDVRDPFVPHTQLDAERTCVQGKGDHGGERDGFPLHQISDSAQSTRSYGKVGASKGGSDSGPAVRIAPASQATSIVPPDLSEDATAHDFRALHLGTKHSTSSSEKVVSGTSTGRSQGIPEQNPGSAINSCSGRQSGGCLADTLGDDNGPANSRDLQSKVQIPASVANTPRPASTPGPGNILPTSSPHPPSLTSINKVLEVSNAIPAEEFPDLSGFSSTAMIPPSSPGLPSNSSGAAFNSDLGDLKRPIQESELPEKGTDSSSTSRPKENVIRAPKPPSSVVTRTSLGIPGDTAGTTAREAQNALPGFPEGCQAFCNELDEEVELSKPGVLTSAGDGGREEPAERWPDAQETNGQYSGRSDRFFFSSAYSLGSNPLMISKSSIASSSTSRSPSNQPEENCYSSLSDHPPPTCAASNCSGGDEATKTSRDSLPPESSSTWDSTAVGTHEFRVVEYPSADLGEAASLRSGDSAYENPSPTFREHSRYQKGSSNKSGSPWNSEAPPGGSPQNVTGPRRGSDGTSFPLRDYVLPAAIAAFTSVVAFLFYKHLRN